MCFETPWTKGKTTTNLINVHFNIGDGNDHFNNFLSSELRLYTRKLTAAKLMREVVIKCGFLANSKGMAIEDLLSLTKSIAIPLLKLGMFNRKEISLFIYKQLILQEINLCKC